MSSRTRFRSWMGGAAGRLTSVLDDIQALGQVLGDVDPNDLWREVRGVEAQVMEVSDERRNPSW